MRFFITGTAGFIGFHLTNRLLDLGHEVVGVDAMTTYYDIQLKKDRARLLADRSGYVQHRIPLEDSAALEQVWAGISVDAVVHLAAQAGVRYSLNNPRAYLESNLVGTFNLLELVRQRPVRHFLFASTSSVYGSNSSVPFRESDHADHPLTFYAATKRSTELMAHSYSHIWNIPATGMRFFTVYGPWGRPDMAPLRFLDAIETGKPIRIYNHGHMARDFTFVEDVIDAVTGLIGCVPEHPSARSESRSIDRDSLSPVAPYRVVNVGGGTPIDLLDFVATLEQFAGKRAERQYVEMQPGDMPVTCADTALLHALTGSKPTTSLKDGVGALVQWYKSYRPLAAETFSA